jgi:hypothetical protein
MSNLTQSIPCLYQSQPQLICFMDSSPQLAHILQKMAANDPTQLPTPAKCTAGEF